MLDRREFIRQSLRAALLTTVGGAVPILVLPSRPGFAAEGSLLAVRTGKNIEQLVIDTLAALGGMEKYVKRGETVVVKPNIGWDRTPELAANTSPELVATLVTACLEAGAKSVRVFDRTCNDPRRCYAQSGIAAAVEALRSERVTVEYMDRRAYQKLVIKDGQELREWEFYQPALEADRLINVPIAKHHSISKLTLGMKNIMGVIGGNRGVLHRNIAEALCDINQVVQSDLTVIDATRILVANGPQGGRPEDVRQLDTLIASPDIVAADSYAATLFGFQPHEIPTLAAAARRGLGVTALDRMRRV
ncbi:MAG: DUF362 domain-containing protein [Desulfuromonadales bacterium]|nr:DUF362 domain-containing protein [Desulfuromonadales bacterium]